MEQFRPLLQHAQSLDLHTLDLKVMYLLMPNIPYILPKAQSDALNIQRLCYAAVSNATSISPNPYLHLLFIGIKHKHTTHPSVSSQLVSVSDLLDIGGPKELNIDTTDCGEHKGCIRVPEQCQVRWAVKLL